MSHFEKYWDNDLLIDVREHAEELFKERYITLYGEGPTPHRKQSNLNKIKTLLRELSSDDEDAGSPGPVGRGTLPSDSARPWFAEFQRYLDAKEDFPVGVSMVQWWGVCYLFFFPFFHTDILTAKHTSISSLVVSCT